MIISTNFLNKSYRNYRKNILINPLVNSNTDRIVLVVAIIFFALELLLVYYAINMAIRCSRSSSERMIHLSLAILFTLPYVLISSFFGECQSDVIKDGNLFLTNSKSFGRYKNTSLY